MGGNDLESGIPERVFLGLPQETVIDVRGQTGHQVGSQRIEPIFPAVEIQVLGNEPSARNDACADFRDESVQVVGEDLQDVGGEDDIEGLFRQGVGVQVAGEEGKAVSRFDVCQHGGDDVRDRVVRMLLDEYGIDVSGLYPADAPELVERLTIEEIINPAVHSLNDAATQDMALIRKTVQASLEIVRQLSADIRLTARLHQAVADWLTGLSATSSRSLLTQRSWPDRKDETLRLH